MKFLTKSRFKLALTCPTKLYYNELPEEYANTQVEDPFLKALAEGGYQVGELAKCYFPGGIDIAEKGYDRPLDSTNALLQQEDVTIFEAAIKWNNCFARVDILQKTGNKIELIEVKAKSFDGDSKEFLNKKTDTISKDWDAYLQDIAFQKYVAQKAFPQWDVHASLMLADKSKRSSVKGLNQKFFIQKEGLSHRVILVGDTSPEALGVPILTKVNVDVMVDKIIRNIYADPRSSLLFEEKIEQWAESLEKKEKLVSPIGAHCFSCQFHNGSSDKKSGFHECWRDQRGYSINELEQPKINEIWNLKGKEKLLNKGIVFVKQVHKEHIGDCQPDKGGILSLQERQWIQVQKTQNNDDDPYWRLEGLKAEMDSFEYPLHFIDFETSTCAIPFYEQQRPYETVAFQFSHHTMDKNGVIEHKSQYIKLERGEFPNFEFVHELKKALEQDNGTVFRFSHHENTVLVAIKRQLLEADLPSTEKTDLINFIDSITQEPKIKRIGERNMVDMCQMVKDYYYDPRTKGSNSIKAVFPSILSRSAFLQEKYSRPVYGKMSVIKSKNFEDGWIWIQHDVEGNVMDPYKLLPKLFEDIDLETAQSFITDDSINSGGAALTAFAKIQFTEISDLERDRVINGLLKYCELDTLAMVMIYEYWKNHIEKQNL